MIRRKCAWPLILISLLIILLKNPVVDFCTLDERVRFNPYHKKMEKFASQFLEHGVVHDIRYDLNIVLLSLQTLLCENPVNNEPGLENIKRRCYSII